MNNMELQLIINLSFVHFRDVTILDELISHNSYSYIKSEYKGRMIEVVMTQTIVRSFAHFNAICQSKFKMNSLHIFSNLLSNIPLDISLRWNVGQKFACDIKINLKSTLQSRIHRR
jgi:hypothetical protein